MTAITDFVKTGMLLAALVLVAASALPGDANAAKAKCEGDGNTCFIVNNDDGTVDELKHVGDDL